MEAGRELRLLFTLLFGDSPRCPVFPNTFQCSCHLFGWIHWTAEEGCLSARCILGYCRMRGQLHIFAKLRPLSCWKQKKGGRLVAASGMQPAVFAPPLLNVLPSCFCPQTDLWALHVAALPTVVASPGLVSVLPPLPFFAACSLQLAQHLAHLKLWIVACQSTQEVKGRAHPVWHISTHPWINRL